MKKIKSIPVFFVAAILCLLLIESCSDEENPITPPVEPYEYDSARFDWKVDTLIGQGFIGGLWASDTNEMFIPNVFTNTLVHIKNGIKTYTQYPEENRLGAIYGDENNNGYRVGSILVDTIYQPLLQRWDGSNFVDLNNPQNLDRNFFYWSAFVKNPSEMWFGLTDGTVIKYNGSVFIHYLLTNPALVITKFFYDEFNILKFIAYDPHYKTDSIEHFVYELRNEKWEIYYRTNVVNIDGPLKYDVIGPNIAPIGLHQIYELVNSVAIPRINVPVYSFYLSLAGSSYSYVLIAAVERFAGGYSSLFHWNGIKWSLELSHYDITFADIFVDNNIYHVITYDDVSGKTFVMQGIIKTNFKNFNSKNNENK